MAVSLWHILRIPPPLSPASAQSPVTGCRHTGTLHGMNHWHFNTKAIRWASTSFLKIREDFCLFLCCTSNTNYSKQFSHNTAPHDRSNVESADADGVINTGKLPDPFLLAVGEFEPFLLYITTSLDDKFQAKIRARRRRRIGHKKDKSVAIVLHDAWQQGITHSLNCF